ncbi:MAG: hypothetical protein AAB561_00075 [Patescibacteria group bacterium]
MRPPQIRDFRYQDKFAAEKRRHLKRKVVFWLFVTIIFLGGLGYLAIFSDIFVIRSIAVDGANIIVDKTALEESVKSAISTRTWGFLPLQNNTLSIQTALLAEKLIREFPSAKSISVDRKFMHALSIKVAERKPLGIWCFGDKCSYFDGDGFTWGEPPKSSGFLLLRVQDTRERTENSLSKEILNGIVLASNGINELGIPVKEFKISQTAIIDLAVSTGKGYTIYLDLDGDIKTQIETLKIFLDKKTAESSFAPQYLDLRISGRVYYK